MKTKVLVSCNEFCEEYSTIEEAIAAVNDRDFEEVDIEVYDADTLERVFRQTAERNPYSGDLVYDRWYIGYEEYNGYEQTNLLEEGFDCEQAAREHAEKYIADDKYDNIFICTYSQTLSENIGDENVQRIYLKGEKIEEED